MPHEHIISSVKEGSIAWEMDVEPGDRLLSVNDHPIEDVFDYRYYTNDTYLTVLIRKKEDGEVWELEIEKDYTEDLGIDFSEGGLMDEYRTCRNNCIFCFIDQMPKGMRETLYFKDDDSRLSFLQGNYVTLTNMSEHDIDRIVKYHLEPMNISFQTMNPDLRCKMLHNRFAGEALKKVDRFYEAGIHMNGQIVLCKGVNDGAELEYSLKEMGKYAPLLQSVSVVPVGLSRFREGLFPLEPFTKADARAVLDTIHKWQKVFYEKYGTHIIHAGDEWYLLAEREVPDASNYDGYLQLENGVGMVRLLFDEFDEALGAIEGDDRKHHFTLATGKLMYPFIRRMAERTMKKFPNLQIDVYWIRNDFFGERITVAGLVTAQDLIGQMKDRDLGEKLIIPECMLRIGEPVFLDDITLEEVRGALKVPVTPIGSSGQNLLDAFVTL